MPRDVRSSKTQISLCIRPVWSKSSLCAQWVAKDPSFLHADYEIEDSEQTGRMLYVGAIIESDARPTGVQLKSEAKCLTVIGLNTKHALYLCYIQYVCNER